MIKKMSDWKGCFTNCFKEGDYLEDAIAWQLIDSVPPHYFSNGIFQNGEPYDHVFVDGHCYARYITLKQEGAVWLYQGIKVSRRVKDYGKIDGLCSR